MIDATKHDDFAKAKAGSNQKILESGDLEKLALTLRKLIQEESPAAGFVIWEF